VMSVGYEYSQIMSTLEESVPR